MPSGVLYNRVVKDLTSAPLHFFQFCGEYRALVIYDPDHDAIICDKLADDKEVAHLVRRLEKEQGLIVQVTGCTILVSYFDRPKYMFSN